MTDDAESRSVVDDVNPFDGRKKWLVFFVVVVDFNVQLYIINNIWQKHIKYKNLGGGGGRYKYIYK